jgi:flagellar biogenesis protein FliO
MNNASDLAMLGRVIGGLVVVLVLVGLIAKVARRARGHNGDSGLRVVDRVGLSREANLAVVEVSNRMLLLGVTAQGVTMLAKLDDEEQASAWPELGQTGPRHGKPVLPTAIHLDDVRLDPAPLDLDRITPARQAEPALAVPVAAAPARPPTAAPVKPTTAPAKAPAATPATARRRPIPATVAVDEYPDLASALRAAGRTGAPAATPAAAQPQGAPRTRAEARARRSTEASSGRNWISLPRNQSRATAAPKAGRVDRSEAIRGGRRVVPQQRTQASGSVLSPKTWSQGIDALRELTVRRG